MTKVRVTVVVEIPTPDSTDVTTANRNEEQREAAKIQVLRRLADLNPEVSKVRLVTEKNL